MNQDDVETGMQGRRGNGRQGEQRTSASAGMGSGSTGPGGGANGPDLQGDLDRLRADFTRLAETVRQWSAGRTNGIAEQVRANPWRAVGIAFAAGILLRPWLLGREHYYYYDR